MPPSPKIDFQIRKLCDLHVNLRSTEMKENKK